MSEPFPTFTKPSAALPPLHTKVLIALKEDPCDPVDVACYTGLPEEEQGAWIGAGGRFYTKQIAGGG